MFDTRGFGKSIESPTVGVPARSLQVGAIYAVCVQTLDCWRPLRSDDVANCARLPRHAATSTKAACKRRAGVLRAAACPWKPCRAFTLKSAR